MIVHLHGKYPENQIECDKIELIATDDGIGVDIRKDDKIIYSCELGYINCIEANDTEYWIE